MKHSAVAAVTLGSALVLALSACGGGASSSSSQGSGNLKIGVALPAGNQMYWTGFQEGAKEAAKELGVDVNFADAKNDAQTMNDQINSLIVSGVKGIAVASVDPAANKSVAQAATDAGIPLITSNRTLEGKYSGSKGTNPVVHTGFDDTSIGGEQAKLVIEACKNIDPCKVIQEVGTLGATPQIDRQKGLEDGLKGQSNIKIVATQDNDFDPTKAASVTPPLLQSHPDANVITTQEDPSAVAVTKVLQEQGLTGKVKVIGVGGSIDGIAAIKDGRMFGSVQVSSHMDGATAVKTIVQTIKGENLTTKEIGGRPTVVVPSTIVTKENAGEHPGDW